MAIPKIRNLIEARVKDTGDTIISSSTDTPLYIQSNKASCWIGFKDNTGSSLGYLGANSTGPGFYKDAMYLLLHSGNYNNYSLSLKGGSLTGNITITVDGNPYYGLNDGTNNWYFQAVKADNACYIGPGYTLATKIDTSGNMTVRGNITVNTAIVPDVAGGANVGTGSLPFLQTVARNHYLYDTNNVQTGRLYTGKVGTTSEVGQAYITIGNSKASGTANNAKGFVVLYGDQTYYSQIVPANGLTAHRTITLPNASGTVALTSNLSSYLPLSGGTLTGNLTIDASNNVDRFITFNSGDSAGYSWRMGYLGTGSDEKNYFVIQSNSTNNTWANVIRCGLISFETQFNGNLSIITGDTDKYITWDYSDSASSAGASWRIGMQGSGSGDANYFVIQTTGSNTGTSETFANAVRISMNNKDVQLSNNLNTVGNYQQNGVAGRLASITSSAPSLTTANKILWAW